MLYEIETLGELKQFLTRQLSYHKIKLNDAIEICKFLDPAFVDKQVDNLKHDNPGVAPKVFFAQITSYDALSEEMTLQIKALPVRIEVQAKLQLQSSYNFSSKRDPK